jgi:uncharacterized protein YjbJ (UPF0337 family)
MSGTEKVGPAVDKLAGAAKETIGSVAGDDDLQKEGAGQKAAAELQEAVVDVKDNVKGAAEDVASAGKRLFGALKTAVEDARSKRK